MESRRHILRVDRREINYLRVTMESYDGMAVVRTLDPYSALIEVMVSPGSGRLFSEVLRSLIEKESMDIFPLGQASETGRP